MALSLPLTYGCAFLNVETDFFFLFRMEEDKNFKDLGICEQLAEACDNLGWKIPTKIQAEAIPHALEGSFSLSYSLIITLFFYSCSVFIYLILFWFF